MKVLPLRDKLIGILPTKKENAMTTKELTALTGLTVRQLKRVISELREEYPICSKTDEGGGYWIATNNWDISEFANEIRLRKESHEKTMNDMLSHI